MFFVLSCLRYTVNDNILIFFLFPKGVQYSEVRGFGFSVRESWDIPWDLELFPLSPLVNWVWCQTVGTLPMTERDSQLNSYQYFSVHPIIYKTFTILWLKT